MQQKVEKPVFAFIDSQNLNLGVKTLGWKLDWRKFRQYLRDKFKNKKLSRLLAPNQHYSKLYKQYSSYIIRIDQIKNSLEYKQKKTGIGGRSKP